MFFSGPAVAVDVSAYFSELPQNHMSQLETRELLCISKPNFLQFGLALLILSV